MIEYIEYNMPRILKGSQEAKDRMNHLRSLRKKKVSPHIEPRSETPPPQLPPKENENEAFVGTGKKTNSWIRHVKEFATSHKMNYFEALKDPKIKEGYKK